VALGAAGGAVAASAIGSRRKGAVAHVGAGLLLVGVAGTMASQVETVAVEVGSTVEVAGVELTHRSIELATTPATSEAIATVEVDGSTMTPRLVSYRLRGVSTAEVAHRFHLADEVQVVLLDGDADGARYRVNHLPRVGLVWLGGAVLVAGLAGQSLRRLRASSADSVDASSSWSPSSLASRPASRPEPVPDSVPAGGAEPDPEPARSPAPDADGVGLPWAVAPPATGLDPG
jgi:hypothetical protein